MLCLSSSGCIVLQLLHAQAQHVQEGDKAGAPNGCPLSGHLALDEPKLCHCTRSDALLLTSPRGPSQLRIAAYCTSAGSGRPATF
jgi:hypothetical protein